MNINTFAPSSEDIVEKKDTQMVFHKKSKTDKDVLWNKNRTKGKNQNRTKTKPKEKAVKKRDAPHREHPRYLEEKKKTLNKNKKTTLPSRHS